LLHPRDEVAFMVGRHNEITAAEIEARLLGALLHPDQDARDADVDQAARHRLAHGQFLRLYGCVVRADFGHGK
jgi:hypothetical protein